MNDWRESSEGDLDPDLTEEAGYAGWDPPRRAWLPRVLRLLAVLVVVGMVGGLVIAATR
jgi:hypothetical protein